MRLQEGEAGPCRWCRCRGRRGLSLTKTASNSCSFSFSLRSTNPVVAPLCRFIWAQVGVALLAHQGHQGLPHLGWKLPWLLRRPLGPPPAPCLPAQAPAITNRPPPPLGGGLFSNTFSQTASHFPSTFCNIMLTLPNSQSKGCWQLLTILLWRQRRNSRWNFWKAALLPTPV